MVIVNGLARLPPDRNSALIKSAIRSAPDLTVLTGVVRGIVGDSHPEGGRSERGRLSFGSERDNIRKGLVDRIRKLARSGKIWKQTRPAELLWFWWGTNKEDEVKVFTAEAMDTPLGLIGLLNSSISTVGSSSGNYERVSPTCSKILDLEERRQRAAALARTGNDAEIKLAERFLVALKRGQEHPF